MLLFLRLAELPELRTEEGELEAKLSFFVPFICAWRQPWAYEWDHVRLFALDDVVLLEEVRLFPRLDPSLLECGAGQLGKITPLLIVV